MAEHLAQEDRQRAGERRVGGADAGVRREREAPLLVSWS